MRGRSLESDTNLSDDRELGLFWSGINTIGRQVDRLIRRLETPAPDQRERIEPHIKACASSHPEKTDSTGVLMALDGVAMDSNIAALKALDRLGRDGSRIDPAAIRTLGDQVTTATEGYVALATDVLELDNPLPTDEPVWAGSLERRFMSIVETAESLLPERLRRAERY